MKENMVSIFLPRGRKNEENFVIVSVNGRSWKIMRGVQVQVPGYVAEVLEQSMAQDNATANLIERQSGDYAAETRARGI